MSEKIHPDPVKDPCNECPWRRTAPAGWLGPWSADEWLMIAHGEGPIACHKTIKRKKWTAQCRGASIFRRNILKMPRNPSIATGPEDRERIFSTSAEFKEHHER